MNLKTVLLCNRRQTQKTSDYINPDTVKPCSASVPPDEQAFLINFNLINERHLAIQVVCDAERQSHDQNWANGSWNSLWDTSDLDYKHGFGLQAWITSMLLEWIMLPHQGCTVPGVLKKGDQT